MGRDAVDAWAQGPRGSAQLFLEELISKDPVESQRRAGDRPEPIPWFLVSCFKGLFPLSRQNCCIIEIGHVYLTAIVRFFPPYFTWHKQLSLSSLQLHS